MRITARGVALVEVAVGGVAPVEVGVRGVALVEVGVGQTISTVACTLRWKGNSIRTKSEKPRYCHLPFFVSLFLCLICPMTYHDMP